MSEPTPDVEPAPRHRRRYLRPLLAVLVSSAAVAIIVSRLDGERAWAAVRGADPGWLLAAGVLTAVTVFVRGVRFHSVCRTPGLWVTTAAIAVQTLINRVAPMRLGELSLPYLLQRHAGASGAEVLMTLVLIRFVELAVVIPLLLLSALAGGGVGFGAWSGLIALVLVGLLLVLIYFRALVRFAVSTLERVAQRVGVASTTLAGRVLQSLTRAAAGSERLSGGQRFGLFALTLAQLTFQIGVFAAILAAFDLSVGPLALVTASCVAFTGVALPVPSVGTVGTLEASWVAGFTWVGMNLEDAILTGLATQVLTLVFNAALGAGGWLFLTRHPPPTPS